MDTNAEVEKEKKEWRNKLCYIDNYPITWKYVALFAKETGDEEADKKVSDLRQ